MPKLCTAIAVQQLLPRLPRLSIQKTPEGPIATGQRLSRPLSGEPLAHRHAPPQFLEAAPPSTPPPFDLTNIHLQRLLIQRPPIPDTRTRIKIIVRMLNKAILHRILMNIIHLLHKSRFARDQESVGMMLPHRIFIASFLFEHLQFFERRSELIFFQMIEYPLCRDSIQIPKRVRRLTFAVSNDVFVIGHYHVSKNEQIG